MADRTGGVALAEALLERARHEDDRAAWEQLLHDHSDVVKAVCRSMTGRRSQSDFEEAVGETYLAIVRSRHQFHGSTIGELRAWLRTIARHEVYRVWRKRRRELARLERARADDAVVYDPEPPSPNPHLEGCLSLLPTRQREALHLSAVEQLTNVEIATWMATAGSGPSPNTVKVWVHRAKRKMAACLEAAAAAGDGR